MVFHAAVGNDGIAAVGANPCGVGGGAPGTVPPPGPGTPGGTVGNPTLVWPHAAHVTAPATRGDPHREHPIIMARLPLLIPRTSVIALRQKPARTMRGTRNTVKFDRFACGNASCYTRGASSPTRHSMDLLPSRPPRDLHDERPHSLCHETHQPRAPHGHGHGSRAVPRWAFFVVACAGSACATRSVPDEWPRTSAASPETAETSAASGPVALNSDPPLPGATAPGWRGLTPDADAGAPASGHHHTHHGGKRAR